MQVVQRWILARLRHRRFFSLAELNRAIRELVEQLNVGRCAAGDQPPRLVRGDRAQCIPAVPTRLRIRRLEALPVGIDYHIEVWTLLFGAVPAAAPGNGGADHRADRGNLPPRQRVATHLRSHCVGDPPPSPSTCRVRTGATLTGRQNG